MDDFVIGGIFPLPPLFRIKQNKSNFSDYMDLIKTCILILKNRAKILKEKKKKRKRKKPGTSEHAKKQNKQIISNKNDTKTLTRPLST